MTLAGQWQIGAVAVSRHVEIESVGGSRFILPKATPAAVKQVPWLSPHFADERGRLKFSVHMLVLQTPKGRRIAVDTCIGNDKNRSIPNWNMRTSDFMGQLERTGISRGSIDTVLCTHLHVDHVGWNTMWIDGRWVPTFPNAKYLFGRVEWEHWSSLPSPEKDCIIEDSVRPIVDAGLAELVEVEHLIVDEPNCRISLKPTPGHTPGHVSVVIESNGQQALITGDCLHHPIQCAAPDMGSPADSDPTTALQTRWSLCGELASASPPIRVFGTHWPRTGHMVKDEGPDSCGAFRVVVDDDSAYSKPYPKLPKL